MNNATLLLRSIIVASTALSLSAALTKPVSTQAGMISGVPGTDPTVTVFKGIPFAAPPTGSLRWAAPQDPVKWTGVRKADKFGANCIQTIGVERTPYTSEFMAHGDLSEDCLFLNIWTPARAGNEKLPVLVYVHGGGNTEGSGSVAIYDGTGIARKGAVLVNINYRLGIFGFFTHPELSKESGHNASGNYAILDQIAALKWVRKNIAAFGGDPERVLVVGQSAGATDIQFLTISPLAKGLFKGVILESGGSSFAGGARQLADSEADGVKFAEGKGVHSLAELRALPWQAVFAPLAPPAPAPALTPGAPDAAGGRGRGGRGPGGPRFGGPVIDGYVLEASPKDVFAQGKQIDVPTIAGWTADENGASPRPNVTAEQFQTQARQRYADKADEFLKLYQAGSDDEAKVSSNAAARDRQRVSLAAWASARARTSKTKAYVYTWDHALPGPDAAQYGAFHTSEVPYVLNVLSSSDRPFTDVDRKIADTLSSYWINFAAAGNPNGTGLPHWPSVDETPVSVMELGDKMAPIPAAGSPAKFELMQQVLEAPAAGRGPGR